MNVICAIKHKDKDEIQSFCQLHNFPGAQRHSICTPLVISWYC